MPSIRPSDVSPRDVYFLMTSLVVPRPIAWVSTTSKAGVRNLAPFSHFTNCSADPPIILFSIKGMKDTLRNIVDTNEFVVNVVTHHVRREMRITSAKWPSDTDEFEMAGLSTAASSLIAPPRVANARASMECKLRHILPMGEGNVVFGDILCFHVADDVMVDGRILSSRLQPVGKLDASNYATIDQVERLDLPADVACLVDDFATAKR